MTAGALIMHSHPRNSRRHTRKTRNDIAAQSCVSPLLSAAALLLTVMLLYMGMSTAVGLVFFVASLSLAVLLACATMSLLVLFVIAIVLLHTLPRADAFLDGLETSADAGACADEKIIRSDKRACAKRCDDAGEDSAPGSPVSVVSCSPLLSRSVPQPSPRAIRFAL